MERKEKGDTEKLVSAVINGIKQKKGHDIVVLNLSKIPNSVSKYFIICHGTSQPQIAAIADAVIDETRNLLSEKPRHKEGYDNAEWILLDYFDVVVHIFQEEKRKFYKLEELWGDAQTENIPPGE